MRRLAALLALSGLLLALGCTSRERLNPLDPGNPETGGRPSGFVALAGFSQVRLQWSQPSVPRLVGFEVSRLLEGDTGYVAVASLLPPSTTSFSDFGLLNGRVHRYRLRFITDRGRSAPAEDFATPGPLSPWVADFGADALVRLTADGRHVAERLTGSAMRRVLDVAVDPVDGRLWSASYFEGSVTLTDLSGGGSQTISGPLRDPTSLAVNPIDHSLWIGDTQADQVFHLPATGTPFLPSLTLLDEPIDVALDETSGAVWACERQGGRVRRFLADGTPQWAATFAAPSRVAIDSVTSQGWVTSFERGSVLRLSPSGVALDTISGFQGPIGVAVDGRRGRIWIADTYAGRVLALRRDGSVEFTVPNLPEVREIAVDRGTGEAWVTLPGSGAVAVIGPVGAELRRLTGLTEPYGIALDDLQQRTGSPVPGAPAFSERSRPWR